MVIENVNTLVPTQDMVLIKLINLEEIYSELLIEKQSTEDDIVVIYGEVTSTGPEVDSHEHCKGLKVGDVVACTQFAGFHIVTNDSNMYKLVRGYDIIGIYDSMEDIGLHNAKPAANRVLVEEYSLNEGEDLILGSSGRDPRLADMYFGVIKGIGPSIKNSGLKEGTVVGYAPYVGTKLREYESEEAKALKIIVEEDILVTN